MIRQIVLDQDGRAVPCVECGLRWLHLSTCLVGAIEAYGEELGPVILAARRFPEVLAERSRNV